MKKLALIAVMAAFATPTLADDIFGVWQTEPDDGTYAHITMKPCGAKICGVYSRSFVAEGEDAGKEQKSPNVGKNLMYDVVSEGDGNYKGKLFRFSNEKEYTGTLKLNGNKLRMGGCVFGGLICSKQTWKRVK